MLPSVNIYLLYVIKKSNVRRMKNPFRRTKCSQKTFFSFLWKETTAFQIRVFFNPKWYSSTISWNTIPYKYVKRLIWKIGTKYGMNSDHLIQNSSVPRCKFNSSKCRCSARSSQQGLPHLTPARKLLCNHLVDTGSYLLSAAENWERKNIHLMPGTMIWTKWHLSRSTELPQGLASTWIIMFKNSPRNKLHWIQNEKETKQHVQFT